MALGKLAFVTLLFLLASAALALAQPRMNDGIAQLNQEGEKLCLTCHSPRFPVTDTIYEHKGRVFFDYHAGKSPCFLCHGDTTVGVESDEPTHRPSNLMHPDWDEATTVGKYGADCTACHYEIDVKEALQAGNIFEPSSPVPQELNVWILTVAAGMALITGLTVTVISFSLRKMREDGIENDLQANK